MPSDPDLEMDMLSFEILPELQSHTSIQYANTISSRSMNGYARRRETVKEAAGDVRDTM